MDTLLKTFLIEGYYHENSAGTLFIRLTVSNKSQYKISVSFRMDGVGIAEGIEQWDEIPTFDKAILRYKALKRKYYAPLCATTEHITVICKQALAASL